MKTVATVVYLVGIVGLFWLIADRNKRNSKALWLSLAWLMISASRPLSFWLGIQVGNSVDLSLEGSPFDRNIYLLLQAAGLIVLVQRRTIVLKFLRLNAPILLYAFYCALSICWSDYPGVAFKRWIKLLGDLTMVLIVLTETDRLSAIKRILVRVGFVLVPLSVLLIKYYPELGRSYSPYEGIQFVSGVAAGKNMLGMTCLVYGLGVWWLFIAAYRDRARRMRTRQLVAYGTVLAMVVWLFRMANSMTSLTCFIMGGCLLAAVSFVRTARKPAVVHLMVAAAVVLPFSVLFLHIGSSAALEKMGRNPTLTGRTEIWAGLLHFAVNPLLGTGFESFWVGERLRRIWAAGELLFGINEAHNGYLEVYLSLGWIGVALLALLIVTGYRNVMVALRRDPDEGRLKLAFFVVAIIYSYTEAGFRIMGPIWTAFLLAITAVPYAAVVRRPRPLDTGDIAGSESEAELIVNSRHRDESFVPVEVEVE
jgi:exopolysaccharide production protein ExoQ